MNVYTAVHNFDTLAHARWKGTEEPQLPYFVELRNNLVLFAMVLFSLFLSFFLHPTYVSMTMWTRCRITHCHFLFTHYLAHYIYRVSLKYRTSLSQNQPNRMPYSSFSSLKNQIAHAPFVDNTLFSFILTNCREKIISSFGPQTTHESVVIARYIVRFTYGRINISF
jgi:hypothetical protein